MKSDFDIADIKRLVNSAIAFNDEEHKSDTNVMITEMLVPIVERIGPANMLLCMLLATAKFSTELDDKSDDERKILGSFLSGGFLLYEQVVDEILSCE